MASEKITELDALSALAAADLFVVVDASVPQTKKITSVNAFTSELPAAFSALTVHGAIIKHADGVLDVSAAGPTDDIDVSGGVHTVTMTTSANNVTIGSFDGGTLNQRVEVWKDSSANIATLENSEGTAGEDIFTNTNADEAIGAGARGHWVCKFNGTSWHCSKSS